MIRKITSLILLATTLLNFACAQTKQPAPVTSPAPVDPTLTPETANLFASIHRIGWDPDKIIFGQEFPLTYRRIDGYFDTDLEQSDCKDLVGDHPGVHGSDFLYLMSRDSAEKAYHIAAAKKAYADGAIVTFDYHWTGKYSDSYQYTKQNGTILYNVVHNDDSNGDVTWFYQSLDEVLKLLNEEVAIPIVFRPFHEMNGNWFWWGRKLKGGPEVYREAYRLLVDYMRQRTDLALFCWSPDKGLFEQYYPGDDYVDIIGMDIYDTGAVEWASVEQMVGWVEDAVDFAEAHGKVAAFTETGHRLGYPEKDSDWWMNACLEPILASPKARKIAWILTWINGWDAAFVPVADSPQEAKDSFKRFHDHPVTLFQNEVAAEKVYSK